MKHRLFFIIALLLATLQGSAQSEVSYAYDALNRLTKVTYANGTTIEYTYDALGNRLSKKVTKGSIVDVLLGDVNGDGIVNVSDVTAIISHILGKNPAMFNKQAADVSGDGLINVTDVTGTINIILNK